MREGDAYDAECADEDLVRCLIGIYHLGDEVGAKSDDGYEGDGLHYSHDGERSAESPHVCLGHYVVGGSWCMGWDGTVIFGR